MKDIKVCGSYRRTSSTNFWRIEELGIDQHPNLTLMEAFPQVDVYTLCHLPDKTYPEFKKYKIKTSLYQYIARNETIMKWLFFHIGLICMKMLKVHGYDVVVIPIPIAGNM